MDSFINDILIGFIILKSIISIVFSGVKTLKYSLTFWASLVEYPEEIIVRYSPEEIFWGVV